LFQADGHRGAIILLGLRLMGHTDVTNLGGGLGAWKTAQLPVVGWVDWTTAWSEFMATLPKHGYYGLKADALNAMLADNPPFLLDIREPAEVEQDGFIAGAVNIPVRDLLEHLDQLPAQDESIVVYCGSGHRGGLAISALHLLGYTDVLNLNGGLGAWKKAALPVETDVGQLATPVAGTAPPLDATRLRDLEAFLSGMPDGFYSVKAADLNVELGETTPPVVVDVRTPEEVALGHIEGSLPIPIEQLLGNLSQLPDKSAPIVLLCQSGHRGAIGLMALRMLGYADVRNLGGGINAWMTAELPLTN
jgi:rhodanese-related sulfurtransferase